ncbi:hypothetical protein CCS41_14750 (plasmid) [Candidatus Fukatsuia symbiotica]|uniref:Phage tail fibre protein N-terminal domain-containing protein n=1 Tax=Candidatus Fukatsuia symbiotica TaxID=1878942 RepID=A0A2U8I975_9GAMM|nr:phage tail protein [Candidatus Fukatsuia symbiotica]AWK15663.1 hypothetical protein CCS41_14750 [Candidatus Fukatsuia symbiotica]
MNSHDVMLSWTAEGDKRLQEARASGSKLQLTHMALGNASTPLSITDLKQAREVRSVIYQAPLDGVTVDREKNSVIGELILPEDKKEEAIREIGIFELDTLVAVGYSSSPYRDVRQQSGERIQLVRLPLNTIPASAIETLSNVINFKESDTRYLHAAENLKDLTNKKTARSNFELGTAAVKNAGTNHSDLITTGEADNRYLKHSENLLATKADKADVSKHSQFFHLFVDDPDVLAYLLQPGLTSDQLEAWLASDNNEEKFTRLFTHSVAIQIIISNSAAFTMLVNSPRAIKAAVKSQAMLVAMVSAEPALAVVVNSQTVMNAVANSRAALDVIGMSTLACQAIEEGQYQVPMIADLGKKIDRKNMAIAVVGNKAIFLGGKTTSPSATIDIYDSQDNYSATIDIYDSQDNSWTTHTASEARYLAEVAVVGNKAIFFGGKTASPSATIDIYDSQDNNSATIDIYDSQDNSWTTHTASEARYLATVAVVGNKAIFFGGETTNIYDSQGNSWTTHKASEARYLATVAVVGNKAIFFGGKTGNDNYSATIDIYDSQGNSWTTHTASEARYLAGVAVVGNKAIFFGGYTTSFTATIDIYDSQDNSWTTHTASEAHYLVTVAVVGNKAIFLGERLVMITTIPRQSISIMRQVELGERSLLSGLIVTIYVK